MAFIFNIVALIGSLLYPHYEYKNTIGCKNNVIYTNMYKALILAIEDLRPEFIIFNFFCFVNTKVANKL